MYVALRKITYPFFLVQDLTLSPPQNGCPHGGPAVDKEKALFFSASPSVSGLPRDFSKGLGRRSVVKLDNAVGGPRVYRAAYLSGYPLATSPCRLFC
jgi:hypothetical protein